MKQNWVVVQFELHRAGVLNQRVGNCGYGEKAYKIR